jgi:hypothetical protein
MAKRAERKDQGNTRIPCVREIDDQNVMADMIRLVPLACPLARGPTEPAHSLLPAVRRRAHGSFRGQRHGFGVPVQGQARYWSLRAGNTLVPDVLWSYPDPSPENPKIRDLLCIFNDRVDLIVDDVPQARPVSPWSGPGPVTDADTPQE